MPRKNRIVVTRPDLDRLRAIVDPRSGWQRNREHLLDFRKELDQARIVRPEEMPADVVTLDSEVRVRNSKTGIAREYNLVCPAHADLGAGQVSVLAPLRIEKVRQPQRIVVGKYQQSLRELASDEIDTLLASSGLDSARVSVFSQENSPFRAIEQVANRIGSDLVVVGTSRFPLFKRVFIGSVSNQVLRGIKHDVLIISPLAARRAHRRAWTVRRRHAQGGEHERIQGAHRVLGSRDTT